MNRNRGVRLASYTLAASVAIGSAAVPAITAEAAPLAGAPAAVVSVEETAHTSESGRILAGATAAIVSSEQEAPAAVQTQGSKVLAGTNLALADLVVETNDTVAEEIEAKAEAQAQAEAEAQAAEEARLAEYADLAIAQVDDFVNVRDSASEEGEVVGKLYNNSAATVLETEGDWYKITSGNVEGYVKAEYVSVGNEELANSVSRRVASVNADALYVRSDMSTDAEVLDLAANGEKLTVTDESTQDQGWIKVSVDDEDADQGEGFVSAEFVELSREYTYAESKAEEEARLAAEEAERQAEEAARAAEAAAQAQGKSNGGGGGAAASAAPAEAAPAAPAPAAPSGGGGAAVANYALQFVGNPYVYGGSSLTNGTDCSGFVMSVYAAFGVGLPHSSGADQGVGYGVDPSQMQAGDIVCYSGHVGICIGGGQIVHASNARDGIKVSSAYYNNILAVRRIF